MTQPADSQPLPESALEKNSADPVVEYLKDFQVIQRAPFRSAFGLLPAGLLLLLLADWLIGGGSFTRDTFRLSAVLTVTIVFLLTNYLFNKVPEALNTIWTRRLIVPAPEATTSVEASFLKFIKQFEAMLNGRQSFLAGLVCALFGFIATYPVQYYFQSRPHVWLYNWVETLAYYLWGHGSIIAPLAGYVIGLLIWRITTIAIYIGKMGIGFTFRMQPNHPDLAGGLKPLGDLCLTIAIIILVPFIDLATWRFVTSIWPNMEGYVILWGTLFGNWMLGLGVASLFVFVQPVYRLHLQMLKRRREILAELDLLSQKIDALSLELRTQAHLLTPQQGTEKLQAIEFMKKVYLENSRIPTWPFDTKAVIQMASAQALPILSMIGSSGPMIEIIKNFLALTTK
jgi:hypothetical protein